MKRLMESFCAEDLAKCDPMHTHEYWLGGGEPFVSPEDWVIEQHELHWLITKMLSTLTLRQEKVLRMLYGLDEEYGHELSCEEVAQDFEVTRERIRQIEAKALRMLRRPERTLLIWLYGEDARVTARYRRTALEMQNKFIDKIRDRLVINLSCDSWFAGQLIHDAIRKMRGSGLPRRGLLEPEILDALPWTVGLDDPPMDTGTAKEFRTCAARYKSVFRVC